MATSAQARPRFSPGFPLHSGGGRDVSSGAHRADQRCLGFPGVSLSPSFAVEGIGVGERKFLLCDLACSSRIELLPIGTPLTIGKDPDAGKD